MKKFLSLGLLCLVTSCTVLDPYTGEERVSKTGIGTGIGALGGALVGGAIGGNAKGALIGAGVGAVTGGMVGNIMDRQDTELRERLRNTGVRIQRLNNNDLCLIMASDVTFENNRSEIRSEFYDILNSVAIVLRKYDRTSITIAGHASSVGDAMHNQILSEKRANAIASYLKSAGVKSNRITVVGYGARRPIANNNTQAGQAKNRRVEIIIHQI